MEFHYILIQLGENSSCETVVALQMMHVTRLTTSVTPQFDLTPQQVKTKEMELLNMH
jgi:hypothetical protein